MLVATSVLVVGCAEVRRDFGGNAGGEGDELVVPATGGGTALGDAGPMGTGGDATSGVSAQASSSAASSSVTSSGTTSGGGTPACGDGACNGIENCSSCPNDCGACDCDCGHDVCFQAGALCETCDACTYKVCQQDPYCCEVEWDQGCVGDVQAFCDFIC